LTRLITNNDPNGAKGWGNLLTKVWGLNFPVDPIQIAREYTRQRFADEAITTIVSCDRSLVEGMLVRRSPAKSWTVLYAAYPEVQGRERFTVAHELGHYLLHRQLKEEFKCLSDDLVDQALKQREYEANEFASYLLMPIDDFRNNMENQIFSLDLLSHCANRYGTTFLATALKWIEFTHELASLVVARDGFILWAKSSESAVQKNIMFRSGKEVPKTSLIAACSNELKPLPKHHSPGVWMPFSATKEYAVLSDKYDLQIAVLLFEPVAVHLDVRHNEEVNLVDDIQKFK
jgi:IrrE N-terminal-like domain